MVLNQIITIPVNNKHIKYYKDKGYNITHNNQIMSVNINDLHKTSNAQILIRCDFCGEIFTRKYKCYCDTPNKKWDACPKCIPQKRKMVVLEKYGVENVMYLDEYKQKVADTNMAKYGVKVGLMNPEIRQKQINTNIKKYGVPYAIAAKQTRDKIEKSFKERYNVINPSQIDDVMNKIQQTRYKNDLQASSKQQRYLCDIIGGELNFPFKRRYIDIALVEDKIAIEYNGGGHNLAVKLGELSEKEFIRNENFRKKTLFENDWKLIEFISPTNKVLCADSIKNIMKLCIDLFNNHNKHYIKIYIDEDKIVNSDETICYKTALNDWNEKTTFNDVDGTV